MARKGAIARGPQLQRLSPGVYRGAGGGLVTQQGRPLPQQRPQPQRPMSAPMRPSMSGPAPIPQGQTPQSIGNAVAGFTPSSTETRQQAVMPGGVNPWNQGQQYAPFDQFAGTRSEGWLGNQFQGTVQPPMQNWANAQPQQYPQIQGQNPNFPSFAQQIRQQFPGTKPGIPGQAMPQPGDYQSMVMPQPGDYQSLAVQPYTQGGQSPSLDQYLQMAQQAQYKGR